MNAALKALKKHWSKGQIFVTSYWKYLAAFTAGFCVAGICSLFVAKSLSGKNTKELLVAIILKRMALPYRNILNYDGFSVSPSNIRPSTELIAMDAVTRSSYKHIEGKDMLNNVKKLRKSIADQSAGIRTLPSFMKEATEIVISTYTDKDLKGYLLQYPGCTMDGIIYYIHGGGFIVGSPKQGFAMLSVQMQYLGISAFAINYNKCPENSLPQIVNECVEGYKYVLNKLVKNKNNKKIFICGESGGGTLVLLTLQKLLKLNISQPCGGIVISAPIDITYKLSFDTQEKENIKDALFKVEPLSMQYIGIDDDDKKQYDNDYDKILSLPKYSPLNGNWKGLCPLYINASQNEVFINDAKKMVQKCKENGVDVEYEWDPYLLHGTAALWSMYIPEARDCLIVIIQWMKKQLITANKT